MREKRQRYQFKDDAAFLADCGVTLNEIGQQAVVSAQAYRMLAEQAQDDWCQRALLVEKLSDQRQAIIALEDTVESLTKQNVALQRPYDYCDPFWAVVMIGVFFIAGLLVGALVTKGSL